MTTLAFEIKLPKIPLPLLFIIFLLTITIGCTYVIPSSCTDQFPRKLPKHCRKVSFQGPDLQYLLSASVNFPLVNAFQNMTQNQKYVQKDENKCTLLYACDK